MSLVTGHARALRRRSTAAETRLWSVLRNRQLNGCKFRRQWPIDRYVTDFACVESHLAVEIDGATHGSPDQLDHDRRRTIVLAHCGYEVLRVTNADVFDNLEGIRETILAALQHRTIV